MTTEGYDRRRDDRLARAGYRTLCFNHAKVIENLDGVMRTGG